MNAEPKLRTHDCGDKIPLQFEAAAVVRRNSGEGAIVQRVVARSCGRDAAGSVQGQLNSNSKYM
jgi:hypothetical protein